MIFVVGNSRSGTTMLGRVFGSHSQVHMFAELHYFEQKVDAATLRSRPVLDRPAAIAMAASLLSVIRNGLFGKGDPGAFVAEVTPIVAALDAPDAVTLYRAVLDSETLRAGKHIALEQTPRYLYLADEILAALPDAHMINIQRDPRDVMLSQKNRWRRTFRSDKKVPFIWTLRSWANYHPWLTARLWSTAARKAAGMAAHPRFHRVKYEDLLARPEQELGRLCDEIGIAYEPAMLAVRQIGSSTRKDAPEKTGFDASRIGQWQQGGLSRAEIAICERTAAVEMAQAGYVSQTRAQPLPGMAIQMALLPVKGAIALAANLNRFRNLSETIRRRLG